MCGLCFVELVEDCFVDNVVVVFGGMSSEYEVSLNSAAYWVKSLREQKDKYNVLPVGINRNGCWFLYSGNEEDIAEDKWSSRHENLRNAFICPSRSESGLFVYDEKSGTFKVQRVDVIFPVLHGRNGEDGTVQGLCELAGVPYIGSDVGSSAVCMDKVLANTLLTKNKIKKADYIWITCYDYLENSSVILEGIKSWGGGKYPLFVKPACAGSSVGVSKVIRESEIKSAVEKALLYDTKVLIEEGINGREIECAVLGSDTEIFTSGLGEILPSNDFYDYESKYMKDSKLSLDAYLTSDLTSKIQNIARKAYNILGCSGLARVDFFVENETDEVFLNEVNTLPAFTRTSMYPKLMSKAGVSVSDLLEKLIFFAKRKKAFRDATK